MLARLMRALAQIVGGTGSHKEQLMQAQEIKYLCHLMIVAKAFRRK